jgi:hypothetical protein
MVPEIRQGRCDLEDKVDKEEFGERNVCQTSSEVHRQGPIVMKHVDPGIHLRQHGRNFPDNNFPKASGP